MKQVTLRHHDGPNDMACELTDPRAAEAGGAAFAQLRVGGGSECRWHDRNTAARSLGSVTAKIMLDAALNDRCERAKAQRTLVG